MPLDLLDLEGDGGLASFLDRTGAQNPGILAYHYPFYRDLLAAHGVGKPLYLAVRDGGELVGVLPGLVRRAQEGAVYTSLPFFGPNGGVLCAPGGNEEEIHRVLLEGLEARLRSEGDVLSASVYTPPFGAPFDLYDRAFPHAVIVEKETQHMGLDAQAWPSKIRYNMNRATRLGVTVSTEVTADRLGRFFALYRRNCEEGGVPLKPQGIIEALATAGVAAGRAHVCFAEHDGRMVAGLMTLWSRRTVSYYAPCTLREARGLQAGTLLIGCAARDAARRGLDTWNWEASPSRESGVYRFKGRWHPQVSPYRIYVLPLGGVEKIRALGRTKLAAVFPYFFVFPYDRL